MPDITCKDCKYRDKNTCDKLQRPLPTVQKCHYFTYPDGSRPRFCRLASSVDEMAAQMVYGVRSSYGLRHFEHTGDYGEWRTREDAEQAAKEWLMEVEK